MASSLSWSTAQAVDQLSEDAIAAGLLAAAGPGHEDAAVFGNIERLLMLRAVVEGVDLRLKSAVLKQRGDRFGNRRLVTARRALLRDGCPYAPEAGSDQQQVPEMRDGLHDVLGIERGKQRARHRGRALAGNYWMVVETT